MFKKISNFLNKKVWQIQLNRVSKKKALGVRLTRIFLLTTHGFTKNQIQLGASSLTYYTLLAVVPIIALLIGVARGFLLEKTFESWLLQQFSEQEEIITRIFSFANSSLERASGGVIAGIGIILLLWAAIKILTSIEFTMNQIWEVKKGRSFFKQFTDFLGLIFFMPLIIFLASGVNVYLSAALKAVTADKEFLRQLQYVIIPVLQLIPFILTGLLWTFLYVFIPNTKVHFVPALIAGFLTSLIYQIVQWAYVYLQVGVASYNAIYGTFAALPLFLIWLNISWLIILLGAKIAYAIQNSAVSGFISEKLELSQKFYRISSLLIAHYCIKKFTLNKPPPSEDEVARAFSLPPSLAHDVLYRLIDAEVLFEVKRKSDLKAAFLPAKNLETLTIKQVIDMIEGKGQEITLPSSHELAEILNALDQFSSLIENSDSNLLLKDL